MQTLAMVFDELCRRYMSSGIAIIDTRLLGEDGEELLIALGWALRKSPLPFYSFAYPNESICQLS